MHVKLLANQLFIVGLQREAIFKGYMDAQVQHYLLLHNLFIKILGLFHIRN